MKKAGIFYLILLILLSAMPCSDEIENFPTVQITFQNISSHQANGDEESCSPACLCMCCGQRVIALQENHFKICFTLHEPRVEVPVTGAKPQQRQNTIWNPPKTA